MNLLLPALDSRAALERIQNHIQRTPCLYSRTLSQITGAEIFLKFENLQYTASFKERGALNKLLLLGAAEKKQGVVAMSAGNHAQGLAYHAGRLGIPVTIVMPEFTPFIKVRLTREFGAKVIQIGKTLTEARDHAFAIQKTEDLTFIHPYDDYEIMAGQGTVALELLEQEPGLDGIVIPVGGGGLLAGMACAAHEVKPIVRITGVEVESYASMQAALQGRSIASTTATIAEGIAVKTPGEKCIPIIREHTAEMISVSEEAIETALAMLINIEKTVVEGAGAASLAALISNPEKFRGQKIALVLSGGNIDARILASVLLRDLCRQGRITRLRIEIQDSPGALAGVATLIAKAGGNIIEVNHQRTFAAISVKNAYLEIALETRDKTHKENLIALLQEESYLVEELHALDSIKSAAGQDS